MTILVSGASGFIGLRLIERLITEGREVVAVSRHTAPQDLVSHPLLHWSIHDIVQDGINLSDLPDIEAIVHLAGATLGAGQDEDQFLGSNEMTTVRLLQSLAGQVDRFVFASSQTVYGDTQHLAVTEDFPLKPDGSAYACSKLNSENWIRWFQKKHAGQYLVLRFCGFIDGGGLIDYLIEQALTGKDIELFAKGVVRRDYLPVSAAIDVLVAALDFQGEPGVIPVNIGSGQAVSAHDLATLICSEIGATSKIKLLDHPPPQGDFVFCIDRAREMFGFVPDDLIDSVRVYARSREQLKFSTFLGRENAKN